MYSLIIKQVRVEFSKQSQPPKHWTFSPKLETATEISRAAAEKKTRQLRWHSALGGDPLGGAVRWST